MSLPSGHSQAVGATGSDDGLQEALNPAREGTSGGNITEGFREEVTSELHRDSWLDQEAGEGCLQRRESLYADARG